MTYEGVIGQFFYHEIIKSNSFLDILKKLCSSAVQRQWQYHSSTGRCACSFRSHCPWLPECEFLKSMGRGRRTNWVAPSLSWYYAFGAMRKTRCTCKEGTCWMNSKHGSLQQLQMLQRTCYIASGKRWTRWDVRACRATDGAQCEVFRAYQRSCFFVQKLFQLMNKKNTSTVPS
jgi:hypothetical protein